jgi:hypothetical protein
MSGVQLARLTGDLFLHMFVSLWHGDDLSGLDLRLGARRIATAHAT